MVLVSLCPGARNFESLAIFRQAEFVSKRFFWGCPRGQPKPPDKDRQRGKATESIHLLQPVTSDVGQMFLFFCQKTEGSTWVDSRNLASLWRNNVNKPCQLFFLPKVEDKRDVIKMDCGHKGRASLTWNDKIQDKGVDDVMRRCLLGSSKQF